MCRNTIRCCGVKLASWRRWGSRYEVLRHQVESDNRPLIGVLDEIKKTAPLHCGVIVDSELRLMRTTFCSIIGGCCCLALLVTKGEAFAQTNVVIDATMHRSIGGEGTLDRAKYFNHWGTHTSGMGSLANELTSTTGLNSVTGRETWEYDGLVAAGLSEDPANPGFFKQSDLVSKLQGSYKDWVVNGSRWGSLRNHPDPVFVQSGRAVGAWPAWIRDGTTMPMLNDGDAYAQLLNAYLEEVVYGTGPGQGYLPFDADRFHIEIMNEPQLELYSGPTWNDVIDFHKNVTIKVKEQFPQASLGGASVGEAPFPNWNPHRWDLAKQMMDDMTTWQDSQGNPVEFDFWTFHPYDVHRVRSTGPNAGNMETQVRESVGHLEGMMDLFENYSDINFGDPKQFAVTEYGATIYTEDGSQNFGSYTRSQRQWDEMRDIKKKLMVFLDRPDRIINATPFIAPQWYTSSSPTEESGAHYVMWDRQSDGSFTETIIGSMYRMYNDVEGDYIGISSDNPDIQTMAFRDNDTLHVLLNNLSTGSQSVNLQALVGSASVTGATIDRLTWNGSQGVYTDDQNVLGSWQNLNLTGEEGAKLTLTLDSSVPFASAVNEQTFYGDDVQSLINQPGSTSEVFNIGATTQNALSARMRVNIAERSNVWNESFQVVVNGNVIPISPTGSIGFDDADSWLFSREFDVPLSYLNDGNNQVYVDFNSNGGQLVTTSLIVTSDPNATVPPPPTQEMITFDFESSINDAGFGQPISQTIGDYELVFDYGNLASDGTNDFVGNQTNLNFGDLINTNMTLVDHSQGGVEVPFRLVSLDFANTHNLTTTISGLIGGSTDFTVSVPSTSVGGNVFEVTQTTDDQGNLLRDTELEQLFIQFINQQQGSYQFPAIDNVVILIGALLDGDFDGNGIVDGRDFLVWQQNPSVGDLADWEANYGNTASFVTGSTTVPEPSALVMLLLGLTTLPYRFR